MAVAYAASVLILVLVLLFRRSLLELISGPCPERERIAPYVLTVILLVLMGIPPAVVGRPRPATGGTTPEVAAASPHPPDPTRDSDPPHSPTPQPRPGDASSTAVVVRGQVQASESEGLHQPLRATVAAGGTITSIDPKGRFELSLLRRPRPEDPVIVEATDCLREVLRFDEFEHTADRGIVVQPAYRVIVVEFEGVEGGRASEAAQTIRSAAEQVFTECPEMTVVSGTRRDAVINVLYDFQSRGGLHEKASLPPIGALKGATHGVFGTARRPDPTGLVEMECSLIDLRSGKSVKTVSATYRAGSHPGDATRHLADALLSELTHCRILSPAADERVELHRPAAGWVRYQPKGSSLWVGVIPHRGGSNLYPQKRVVVSRDTGTWIEPSVCIGQEASGAGEAFEICAILADAAGTARIDAYRASGSNAGIDPSAWRDARVKVLHRVKVLRRAVVAPGGTP